MSTIVRQNFVTETTTLKLRVAPPQENLEFGNWGFLQTATKESVTGDMDGCYSHPLCRKPSFSALSAKSLELCTENLGSETGSDIVTDGCSIFSCTPPLSPSSDSSGYSTPTMASFEFGGWAGAARDSSHRKEKSACRKGKDFPPPLTTMGGLQVRRRRAEGGRLIMEAVETPYRKSYLQAERSDGRLRLCFLTASDAAEATCSDAAGELKEDECGGGAAKEEEVEDSGPEFVSEIEELDGEINREMEVEKFRRPSRCKDGSHGREGLCCNWKPPLWVATS